ncbi:hypothetical protein ACOSP7_004922 [Xanthoceras sorbifolium]
MVESTNPSVPFFKVDDDYETKPNETSVASSIYRLGPPPPYVDHHSAKKVRNDVNVHKDTLRIEVDEQNPDHVLVSFVFDAMFDGRFWLDGNFEFEEEDFGFKVDRFGFLGNHSYLCVRRFGFDEKELGFRRQVWVFGEPFSSLRSKFWVRRRGFQLLKKTSWTTAYSIDLHSIFKIYL